MNKGLSPRPEKKPFVEADSSAFDEHFEMIVGEIGGLATKSPEAMELLKHFSWKGLIAIKLQRINVKNCDKRHKATFMINLKAKEHHL